MPILTYHHIGDCPAEQTGHRGLWVGTELFDEQLGWLKQRGWQCVTISEVRAGLVGEGKLPSKWVAITFDDGWRDNFTKALPLLEKHGFRATVFLVTSKLAVANRPDDKSPSEAWDEYLSADEIATMAAKGIEFGSHTHTHPRLTALDDTTIRAELRESREIILGILGKAPGCFCYPYGNLSPHVAELVKEAGYSCATSTIRDNRASAEQLFWLPRIMVMNDTQPARFGYMFSPLYHWLHKAKNRKRWPGLQ